MNDAFKSALTIGCGLILVGLLTLGIGGCCVLVYGAKKADQYVGVDAPSRSTKTSKIWRPTWTPNWPASRCRKPA